ncbi:hypothetical protein M0L20_28830 [Spirosoma sp. RP8]|uniref:Uncharacterized protein n=1 Tax=Spirosoma liriopis TaxID=2937440 RepID=A0ABT0HUN5_9BACT|nr:hypothetical protein [Spirosoma liriopis]MCK8495906.1 hypothetical protein [Spirosoma liriopis]
MSNTDDGGLIPASELPNDCDLLKEYIARQHELLGTLFLQYTLVQDDNADLRRKLKHLATFRSSN